jgi:hypothetical protein
MYYRYYIYYIIIYYKYYYIILLTLEKYIHNLVHTYIHTSFLIDTITSIHIHIIMLG